MLMVRSVAVHTAGQQYRQHTVHGVITIVVVGHSPTSQQHRIGHSPILRIYFSVFNFQDFCFFRDFFTRQKNLKILVKKAEKLKTQKAMLHSCAMLYCGAVPHYCACSRGCAPTTVT